jgi:hypothetical protein
MVGRMTAVNRDITFFFSNSVERETVLPVYEVAVRRGYTCSLSEHPFQKAEIGLYCQHNCFPANSKLSLVMLHDMAQGQLVWPNLWRMEPWHRFDVGILPGETWARRWRDSSWHPYSRPRQGVFALGWPKSDASLRDRSAESAGASAVRAQLGLKHDATLLYAPAWENDGKQEDFVNTLMDLPVNLLLKQFPWTDQWPDMVTEVARVNQLHENIADNVHIVDPTISIMHCIELADMLVSEESSCLLEALLLAKPTIAVSDWLIPDTMPPRLPAAPFDVIARTPRVKLRETVEEFLADLPRHRREAERLRDLNFCNLGNSAELVMDLVDSLVENGRPPTTLRPEIPAFPLRQVPPGDIAHRLVRNAVYRGKYLFNIKQPLKATMAGYLRGKQRPG